MKFVIIGAGAAGMTAAAELRKQSPEAEITMISSDDYVHSRCMLHKYISGERDEAGLNFTDPTFFQDHGINWEKGAVVKRIDTDRKNVITEEGKVIPYDRLLIATGSNSFIPPVGDFRIARNVYGLRHLSDAQAIRREAGQVKKVLIVGSGLVGLDAAYGLLEMGKEVTVVEMAPRILPIQLDEHAAYEYQKLFEKAGCRFVLGRKADRAVANEKGRIDHVTLDNGEVLDCDLIIVAAGVRPATGFLEGGAIKADRGIAVNDRMQTSVPDVYAAGDVAGLSGIWPNAMKQGQTAALNMCGIQTVYDDCYALKNTINFFGLVSLCIGAVQTEDGDEIEVREDQTLYKRAVIRDNRLKSMLLQGNIDHAGIWQYLIKNAVDLSNIKKPVFQLTFADFYGTGERGKYVWNTGAR